MLQNFCIFIIEFYRGLLLPWKIPSCRFYPTCSIYAIESIEQYGVFKGILKSIARLLRCQPFYKGNIYDPVYHEYPQIKNANDHEYKIRVVRYGT